MLDQSDSVMRVSGNQKGYRDVGLRGKAVFRARFRPFRQLAEIATIGRNPDTVSGAGRSDCRSHRIHLPILPERRYVWRVVEI